MSHPSWPGSSPTPDDASGTTPESSAPENPFAQPGDAPQDSPAQGGAAPYGSGPVGPPPYGAPSPYGFTPQVPQQTGTNGFAITALVLSLVGPFTCGLSLIPAVIFGVLALSQIKDRPQEGRGLAIASLWISGVLAVIGVLLFILSIVGSWWANEEFKDNFENFPTESYSVPADPFSTAP